MHKFMSIREMWKLAITKWEYIANHMVEDSVHARNNAREVALDVYPQLRTMKSHCSLCEVYYKERNWALRCNSCPLHNSGGKNCVGYDSFWGQTDTRQGAREMFDVLCSLAEQAGFTDDSYYDLYPKPQPVTTTYYLVSNGFYKEVYTDYAEARAMKNKLNGSAGTYAAYFKIESIVMMEDQKC